MCFVLWSNVWCGPSGSTLPVSTEHLLSKVVGEPAGAEGIAEDMHIAAPFVESILLSLTLVRKMSLMVSAGWPSCNIFACTKKKLKECRGPNSTCDIL